MAVLASENVREHFEYEKMPETTSKWSTPVSQLKGDWVVTEKAHGANFAFVCDCKPSPCVRAAKRTELLPDSGEVEFFGFQEVLKRYRQNALDLLARLASEMPATERVTIYGELIGGGYPGAKETLTPAEIRNLVQTEILYCPHHDFYAFDVAVETTGPSGLTREYLPYDKAMSLFEEFGFFYARPLFVGSFEKALDFNVDFVTTIPPRLGLTVTKENKAEGVVIKPLNKVLYVETSKGRSRAIVKKKAVQFTEKVLDSSKSRHQQARERNKETHSDDPWIAVEAEITSIENILFPYINEARLFSVISKEGKHISNENLAKLVVRDALKSAKEEDSCLKTRLLQLPEQQRDRLTADVASYAISLINLARQQNKL